MWNIFIVFMSQLGQVFNCSWGGLGKKLASIVLLGFFLLPAGGCYNKPVRHLASDAVMIVPDKSTRQDVMLYLGEPDGHRMVSPEVEEYVYYEDRRGGLKSTPIINLITDPDGYEMIIVTLSGDLVTSCEFRSFSEDDLDKVNSYTWDEVK